MMGNLLVVIEFVQRILQIWLNVPTDFFGIRRLSAAMTNTVYIISNSDCNLKSDEPRKLLLRIYGEGIDNVLDRRIELDWFVKVSKARAGPRLLATFQNGRIEEYIDSVTLTPRMMRDSDISRLIAKAMAKFHQLEMERDEVVLWKRIENWRNEARKAFKSLLKRFSQNQSVISKLEKIRSYGILEESEFRNEEGKFKKHFDKLVSYESPIVPCHNDLQHGNILLNSFNEIVFIDYEYGGMNYAAYDIANHFCEWASDFTEDNPTPHMMNFEEHYPNFEQREQFIREYLKDASPSEVSNWIAAVEDFKELTHLVWAYWGIIQGNSSTIDFDYLGYSLMRLEAMRIA